MPPELAALQAAIRARQWPHAVALAQHWTTAQPQHGLGWALRGEAHMGLADWPAARAAWLHATALMPTHPAAWLNLGSCCEHLGDAAQAEGAYRQALSCHPGLAEAHGNLGALYARHGHLDAALARYETLLRLQPTHAVAAVQAAALLLRQDRTEAALALCDRVMAHGAASLPLARIRLQLLLRLERWHDALSGADTYETLHALPGAFGLERARALHEQHQHHAVLSALDQWLHHSAPRLADGAGAQALEQQTHLRLRARALQELGQTEAARRVWAELAALGDPAARVQQALVLRRVIAPPEEAARELAAFDAGVRALLAAPDAPHIDAAALDDLDTGFYLIYYPGNLRPRFEAMAALLRRVCPALAWHAPHVDRVDRSALVMPPDAASAGATTRAPLPPRRPRIGIYSHCFKPHSVTIYFGHSINALLQRDDMDVWLLSSAPVDAALYPGATTRTVTLPRRLAEAREHIAALELDILIYTEFATESLGTGLAHARLARQQVMLVGIACTSGLPEIDWFVTSPRVEPPDAESHYSERLLWLPRVLFRFARPALPAKWRSRVALGLPEGVPLYVVPVRLQKVHPDFDALVSRILQQDPHGLVLFFKDHEFDDWRHQIGRRFDQTLHPHVRSRVRFAQWLDEDSLLQVLHASDVILDPLHFGMGATGRLAFATGTPVVTLRGACMRARVCASMCDLLDLGDCVADDADGYVARALRAAHDLAWRASIRARMLGNSAALYEVDSVSEDFAQALLRLHRGEDPSHPLARLA